MLYLSHLGEPKGRPTTRTLGQFLSPVRAELPTLWKRFVCQKRGVQKVSFLLVVLKLSMIYTSWSFEVMS